MVPTPFAHKGKAAPQVLVKFNISKCFCVSVPRFWDLAYPERSYIVAGSSNCPSVSYYRKIIEGTEVVQVPGWL